MNVFKNQFEVFARLLGSLTRNAEKAEEAIELYLAAETEEDKT